MEIMIKFFGLAVAQPADEKWRPEDLATVGELLLDISTSLAQM